MLWLSSFRRQWPMIKLWRLILIANFHWSKSKDADFNLHVVQSGSGIDWNIILSYRLIIIKHRFVLARAIVSELLPERMWTALQKFENAAAEMKLKTEISPKLFYQVYAAIFPARVCQMCVQPPMQMTPTKSLLIFSPVAFTSYHRFHFFQTVFPISYFPLFTT